MGRRDTHVGPDRKGWARAAAGRASIGTVRAFVAELVERTDLGTVRTVLAELARMEERKSTVLPPPWERPAHDSGLEAVPAWDALERST